MPYPIYKLLAELDHNDIQRLIGEEESKTLDFKQDAYPEPDTANGQNKKEKKDKNEWRRELCKDISALANAEGGWIICGISEEDRKAVDIKGLGAGSDFDKELLRLEQVANSQIEPPIRGLRFRAIDLPDPDKKGVIVIYVPRSPAAPHRSKLTWKFYLRRSSGVQDMNISEVRTAFNLSEAFDDRVRQFRRQRVEAINIIGHDDVPILLQDGHSIIVHLVPLTFADPSNNIDMSAFSSSNANLSQIFRDQLRRGRYNFDGYVIPISPSGRSYYQFFRTGAVEYVTQNKHHNYPEVDNVIHLGRIVQGCLEGVSYSLQALAKLQVEPPFVLMVSLLGLKGMYLAARDDEYYIRALPEERQRVTRNNLLISDVICEDYDQKAATLLHHVFDIIWNTAGYERCPYYDQDGNWIERTQRL